MLKVTLLPRGSSLVLFDGEGHEVEALLVGIHDGQARVQATADIQRVLPLGRTELVMGLPRKPVWERVLRMGTELGVSVFRPFVARRSVAKGEHLQRWERLVESAAQQCGRADVPAVRGLEAVGSMDLPALRLAMVPGASRLDRPQEDVALLVGPEGGLHPDELANWQQAGLGPTTLRADTAAVAALALYRPIP